MLRVKESLSSKMSKDPTKSRVAPRSRGDCDKTFTPRRIYVPLSRESVQEKYTGAPIHYKLKKPANCCGERSPRGYSEVMQRSSSKSQAIKYDTRLLRRQRSVPNICNCQQVCKQVEFDVVKSKVTTAPVENIEAKYTPANDDIINDKEGQNGENSPEHGNEDDSIEKIAEISGELPKVAAAGQLTNNENGAGKNRRLAYYLLDEVIMHAIKSRVTPATVENIEAKDTPADDDIVNDKEAQNEENSPEDKYKHRGIEKTEEVLVEMPKVTVVGKQTNDYFGARKIGHLAYDLLNEIIMHAIKSKVTVENIVANDTPANYERTNYTEAKNGENSPEDKREDGGIEKTEEVLVEIPKIGSLAYDLLDEIILHAIKSKVTPAPVENIEANDTPANDDIVNYKDGRNGENSPEDENEDGGIEKTAEISVEIPKWEAAKMTEDVKTSADVYINRFVEQNKPDCDVVPLKKPKKSIRKHVSAFLRHLNCLNKQNQDSDKMDDRVELKSEEKKGSSEKKSVMSRLAKRMNKFRLRKARNPTSHT